jgi:DNA-binding NarL/FixJ family response regulator
MRIALARLLMTHGHQVVTSDQTIAPSVWLVDLVDDGPLPALFAALGRTCGLVVLSDDPTVVGRVARARPAGWACLARDPSGPDLDVAVRAAEVALVLVDAPTFAGLSGAARNRCRGPSPLTRREQDVLQLLAEGLPNKGVGRALGISENTAKFHVASICAKLDARSRTEAVAIAARHGLLLF